MLFAAILCLQLNVVAAFGQTVVKGSVKDNTGKPVSGVVVTDGAHFKTTDAQGNYVLNTDPARYPMVYISTDRGKGGGEIHAHHLGGGSR